MDADAIAAKATEADGADFESRCAFAVMKEMDDETAVPDADQEAEEREAPDSPDHRERRQNRRR